MKLPAGGIHLSLIGVITTSGCGGGAKDIQRSSIDSGDSECADVDSCDPEEDEGGSEIVSKSSGGSDDPDPVQLFAGMAASVVIGQASMTGNSSNQGESIAANTLASPDGVGGDGTRLAIADRANNRILIYNNVPEVDDAEADVVLGASDMTTAGSPVCDKETFNSPRSVAFANGKLFIADAHHRAYVYNTIPTSMGAEADVYFGKSDCTGGTGPGELQSSYAHNIFAYGDNAYVSKWNESDRKTQLFSGPDFTDGMTATAITDTEAIDVWTDGTVFCTADLWGNKVRIWNGIPSSSSDLPAVTLGTGGTDESQFNQPHSCTYTGSHFVVADTSNHRILVWNGLPSTDNQAADFVIGQADFGSKSANRGGSVTSESLNKPTMVRYVGGKLFVVDQQNHRVLVFQG